MKFPWVKRTDLVAVPHDSGGWVVKDPLTLQYALLEDHEYSILNLLDGRLTFSEILNRSRQAAPSLKLTAEDLAGFIQNLAGSQLIRQSGGGDSARLNPRTRRSVLALIVAPLLQLLRIQVRLLNPTKLIDAIMPFASIFFGRVAASMFCAFATIAVCIVSTEIGTIGRELPTLQEFLGPRNLVLMLGIFVCVKMLHEMGHAITARRYGAECHECGVMLMVFTPVLYTNVSDTWLLTRRQRMLVTAAGILVELAIASICTILWWHASPGLARSLLLNTMILCSVNTVLFNGNPLLRFDGYFLLTDWLGIPNLAARSAGTLRESLVHLLTGRFHHAESHSERRRRILLLYGICSGIYRVALTFAILKLVEEMAKLWHVQFLGSVLFAVITFGFVVSPVTGLVMAIRGEHLETAFTRRTWVRLVAGLGLLLAMIAIPLPRSIVAPAFVQPGGVAVFAPIGGRLESQTNYGERVAEGSPVVRLVNPDLRQTQHRLQAQVDAIRQELSVLLARPETALSESIPGLKESLAGAEKRQQDFEAEYSQLDVLAPVSGLFQSPPSTQRQKREDLPELWYGRPADVHNKGAWIERGTLLGYVGQPHEVSLLVAVNEDDVEHVTAGQTIAFAAHGNQAMQCEGTITSVALVESNELPLQFSIAGAVPGQLSHSGMMPSRVTFLCTATFAKDAAFSPALYAVGDVRVQVRPASVFHRVSRYLKQTF